MNNARRYLHFVLPDGKREYLSRRLVGFTCEQMYTVVADVKNYKKFIPFCKKSIILSEIPNVELNANLEIGFPPVVENYTSKVTLKEPNLVRAICRDGRVFNYMETTWKFSPGLKSIPQTSIVEFYINFEFKNLMYSKLASFFFDRIVKQMEGAFLNEVKNRYGVESVPTYTLQVKKS